MLLAVPPAKVNGNKKDRARPGMLMGELRLIRRVRKPKGQYGDTWQVQCSCASPVFTVKEQYLFRNPNPKRDCGCSNKGLPTLHKREYNSWSMLWQRCYNPKHVSYRDYGAKGVRVCADWHKDNPAAFANFLRDMGKRPLNMTLDRKDPRGNYEKDNCRWATAKVQASNKRANYAGPRDSTVGD